MQTSLAWVFLLTLLVSYGDALRFFEEPCGSSRPKVINGQNEVIQAAAWMAAISNATYFLCVGTLINKHFVLAAAHCIYNHGDLFVKFETYPESEPPEMYAASLAVIHHSYVELDRSNDIGLLKLSRPVVYNGFIITNARGIPLNPDSLDVGVAGATRIYDEFRVDSIFKHPLYTHNYKNDIALLKLKRPVIIGNLFIAEV
ncbi:hypothetical protein M5D96_009555 [Drosophila gunungcola]|uniref:Peptidase S1 domain-containing protein n=1 Tax=Drosophila gunungcola TaxID=103775 RepID=A0A9P9YI41_9MUSC|nr:hypothetical protein M5D96_009555 [Drosophila gunungcola]